MQATATPIHHIMFSGCDAVLLNNTTPLEVGATDWQGCFVCALEAVHKRRTMRLVDWGASITGRVPERIWKSTDPIFIQSVVSVAAYSAASASPQVRVTDLCSNRLNKVLLISRQFLSSYNQIFVQGAASYCLNVLKRLDESKEQSKALLAKIRKFTSLTESLCVQYEKRYSASFSLLNLQALEDQFEMIQAESASLKIFPLLRDIPTKDLVRP